MLEKMFYKLLLKHSFNIPVKIVFWDGSSVIYGDGTPEVTVIFNEKIPVRDITKNASIALGKTYMDKKIEIRSSIQELIKSAHESTHSFIRSSKFRKFLPRQGHSEKEDGNDVQSHYDVGNDFCKLWLDDTLTYSCAYFTDGSHDGLTKAQVDKVHHILERLDPKSGKTLLDIGCGWETLMLAAAGEYGLKVTGAILNEEQYHFVEKRTKKEGLQDVAEVKLVDYRELGGQKWDYIISVGVSEHVGKENLGFYFKDIQGCLADDGVALIHGITRQQGGAHNGWTNKCIFPGGYVPGSEEMIDHIEENHMQIADIEMLRRHYQHTLEIWDMNFSEHHTQILDMMGERFTQAWDLYLQACVASFEPGSIDVIQYLITKGPSGKSLPMTRDYMTK